LTDLNQPSLPPLARQASAASLHATVKAALALLALVLLGLLLWQLFAQFRHTQAEQRQQHLVASAELADHLSLNLALKAEQATNVVQPYVKAPAPDALPSLLGTLRQRLPTLQQLAWLDHDGRIVGDTLSGSPDRQMIGELLKLNQGRSYLFANAPGNRTIYLLLRQSPAQDPRNRLLRLLRA